MDQTRNHRIPTMDGTVLVAVDDRGTKVFGPFTSEQERWDLADVLQRNGYVCTTMTLLVPFWDMDDTK